MKKQYWMAVGLILTLGGIAPAHAEISESEQVSKIAELPLERCRGDLAKLHGIYEQAKNMSDTERDSFLQQIGENLKQSGAQLPPPPAPCSVVHYAIERRCGDVAATKAKCGS